METSSISRRRQGALLAAALIATAGSAAGPVHDGLFLASLVAAGGLLWTSREWKAWLLAAPMVLGGLVWSGMDPSGCSTGARGRFVYEKLVGHLPYVPWAAVKHEALAACQSDQEAKAVAESVKPLDQKTVSGRQCGLYQTSLGNFWIAEPGKGLLGWLVWELNDQHDYEDGPVTIRAGDTVIDCGAHVGTFTRYALQRGARRVVAIEPASINIAMLEANFPAEIASGRVQLIKAGVWDRKGSLELETDDNSARNTLVKKNAAAKTETVPVVPLDEIVNQLQLSRVDFIKMDIEGAERRALRGASRTIEAFHPRMAICTYHLTDDAEAIPAVVQKIFSQYHIRAKDIERGWNRFTPKVLFFHL